MRRGKRARRIGRIGVSETSLVLALAVFYGVQKSWVIWTLPPKQAFGGDEIGRANHSFGGCTIGFDVSQSNQELADAELVDWRIKQ